jgi:hypothetical protein
MLQYESIYDGSSKPRMVKRYVASSGETFDTQIDPARDPEDCDSLSVEQVYDHMSNLLSHLKATVNSSEVIAIDEGIGGSSIGVKNWVEVQKIHQEIVDWWVYIYFRPETDGDPA